MRKALVVLFALLLAASASAQVVCTGGGCSASFTGNTESLTLTDSTGTARAKIQSPATDTVQLSNPAATSFGRAIFGTADSTGLSLYLRADQNTLQVRTGDNATLKNFTVHRLILDGESQVGECADGVFCYYYSNGWIGQALGGGAAVASTASMPAPIASVYHVTGTTGFNSISSTSRIAGFEMTLIFDGILTVTTGTGNLRLAGAANFVTSADDTLTLVFDGTNWYEKCRSVN